MRRVLLCIRLGLPALILLLYLAAIAAVPIRAQAHDSWISRGGLRNAAGEWCCGLGDCGLVDAEAVHVSAGGYEIHGNVTIGFDEGAIVTRVDELVPFAEAQPSPDGAYWRCKRPDGSRRCFFAPPPNT
jgi:hypothetical protein